MLVFRVGFFSFSLKQPSIWDGLFDNFLEFHGSTFSVGGSGWGSSSGVMHFDVTA